jgi:ribosomal protein L24
MMRFSKGDEVVIRFGKLQGQKGKVIETQPAQVYKVKTEDGSVHYFTWKGLQRDQEGVQEVGC